MHNSSFSRNGKKLQGIIHHREGDPSSRTFGGFLGLVTEKAAQGRLSGGEWNGSCKWLRETTTRYVAPGGIRIAEIRTKVKDHEWQILDAFIGYRDRHLGEQIDSISISYRLACLLPCDTDG